MPPGRSSGQLLPGTYPRPPAAFRRKFLPEREAQSRQTPWRYRHSCRKTSGDSAGTPLCGRQKTARFFPALCASGSLSDQRHRPLPLRSWLSPPRLSARRRLKTRPREYNRSPLSQERGPRPGSPDPPAGPDPVCPSRKLWQTLLPPGPVPPESEPPVLCRLRPAPETGAADF